MSLEGSICAASPGLCLFKEVIYGQTEHFIGTPKLTGTMAILLNILQVLIFIYALLLLSQFTFSSITFETIVALFGISTSLR